MSTELPTSLKRRFIKLGFKKSKRGGWSASFVKSENVSFVVDFSGQVYVYEGFHRFMGEYRPQCVRSFSADTPAKIEVLVEPLLQ